MATNQRERAQRNSTERDKRPYAIARYIRISSYKVGIVLDLIRGKEYGEAVNILKHTNKSACYPVLKVLNSAAANAENNMNIPKDSLYVAECFALAGPTLKRMMVRARGRGDRILKRTSHIKVILGERESAVTPGPQKKVAAKKTTSEKPATKKEATKPTAVEKADAKVVKAEGAVKKAPAKSAATAKKAPVKKEGEAKKAPTKTTVKKGDQTRSGLGTGVIPVKEGE